MSLVVVLRLEQCSSSRRVQYIVQTTVRGDDIVTMDTDSEVTHDFRFLQQYKSGRVVRFNAADTVPRGHRRVVQRRGHQLEFRPLGLALPPAAHQQHVVKKKLLVTVYYHVGGAFVVGSTAHLYNLNGLIVSPEYRVFVAGVSAGGNLAHHEAA
jgi:hypothetical protein